MSLLSIIKEINTIKNHILELKTNMYLELDDLKKSELENIILEHEGILLDLEKKFKLQIILNKIKNQNKKMDLKNNDVLDTPESSNIDFPDDFTLSKDKLIADFNNLINFKEEKRKYKKLVKSNDHHI